MCCREPEDGLGIKLADEQPISADFNVVAERSKEEQAIMDYYHPVWYDRRHGYQGTTHEEAEEFCKNIGGKRNCPLEAYCPNGLPTETTHRALFLDREPFEGEQWAPFSSATGGGSGNLDWVLIGTVKDNPTSTCGTYENLKEIASWKESGTPSEHKKHVLCCADEDEVNQIETLEEILKDTVNPVWFTFSDGWNGGSYDDAVKFCNGQPGLELCSYSAFCPYGDGKSVMGGHPHDFDREGEQWAPYSNAENGWVMIGQKYQNSATTCATFEQLEVAV